jgi:hypothetical protein
MDESVVREGEFRVCATLRRRAPVRRCGKTRHCIGIARSRESWPILSPSWPASVGRELSKYHENLKMFEENRNERIIRYVDKLRRELKPGQFIEVLMAIVSPEHFYNVSDRTVLKRVEEYFRL